jgi:cysteine desulfurase family protein
MIYLDNAATSFPKPEQVYQTLDVFARRSLANPGRAGHRMAIAAEKTLEGTRHALHRLFQGESHDRWILTYNCTDSLNIAIKGIVRPGDHVVTTDLEHNSISRPLQAMAKAGTIRLTRIASEAGYVNPESIKQALTPETKLVAMTHASNVLGTVQDIKTIAPIVRDSGAFFLVDAAQSAGVVPIDLKSTPIDFLAFPGHKALYGPTGTGALYVGPRTDGHLSAWREGGTGGDSSSPTQPATLPFYLEGGTPNVLGFAGLISGIAWVVERGPDNLRKHEVQLLSRVVDWAESSSDWKIAGRWDPDTHVGALSLIVPNSFSSHDIAGGLEAFHDIAVRPGLHCSPYIHKAMGTSAYGTVRISPSAFTTEKDIATLLEALTAITAIA